MHKRTSVKDYSCKRLLSWEEAREYTSLGRAAVRDYGEKIGAIKYYGRRVLFDRMIIDENIDAKRMLFF